MSLLQLAFTFFLITNSIGNIPTLLALVKDFDFKQQRRILIREGVISLLIALFFQYFGEFFLSMLNVKDYSLTFAGAIIILIISLEMIFPHHKKNTSASPKTEPFIVPIAIPLISGAGILSMIMLFSKQEANNLKMTAAILIAWAGIIIVMALAPYLQKILGKRGLLAMEQLMGMILVIVGTGLFVKGFFLFKGAL